MVTKLDVLAIVVTTENISPDSEQDVPRWRYCVKYFLACLVALWSTLSRFCILLDFFGCQFCMNIHEFKDLGADFLVFFKFNLTEDLDILIAPVKLCLVMHRLGFTNLVLHWPNNILGNLAHVHGWIQIGLLSFSPLGNECIKVCLSIDVGQGVARQSLGL